MGKTFRFLFNFSDFRKQLLGIVAFGFLATFFVVRIYTDIVKAMVYFKGYHIHHFYFGVAALAVGGILAILNDGRKMLRAASLCIGIGLGLFADEIGLLLNCTSEQKICTSYFPDILDIVGIIFLILLVLLVFITPIERALNKKE